MCPSRGKENGGSCVAATFFLLHRSLMASTSMQLFVRVVDDGGQPRSGVLCLQVDRETTFLTVKRLVERKTSIPVARLRQTLRLGGLLLRDEA